MDAAVSPFLAALLGFAAGLVAGFVIGRRRRPVPQPHQWPNKWDQQ